MYKKHLWFSSLSMILSPQHAANIPVRPRIAGGSAQQPGQLVNFRPPLENAGNPDLTPLLLWAAAQINMERKEPPPLLAGPVSGEVLLLLKSRGLLQVRLTKAQNFLPGGRTKIRASGAHIANGAIGGNLFDIHAPNFPLSLHQPNTFPRDSDPPSSQIERAQDAHKKHCAKGGDPKDSCCPEDHPGLQGILFLLAHAAEQERDPVPDHS